MSKGNVITSSVEDNAIICTSVQTVQLCAQNSLAIVETIIELDSHADTCVVGDHFLVVHDHNRPVNVFGFYPKAGLKCACMVDAVVACTEPETDQVVILIINQAIEMKGPDHHLLHPIQCCMNGVLINEVWKFLAPVPSETMHAIHLVNPVDTTYPIIIPLK